MNEKQDQNRADERQVKRVEYDRISKLDLVFGILNRPCKVDTNAFSILNFGVLKVTIIALLYVCQSLHADADLDTSLNA